MNSYGKHFPNSWYSSLPCCSKEFGSDMEWESHPVKSCSPGDVGTHPRFLTKQGCQLQQKPANSGVKASTAVEGFKAGTHPSITGQILSPSGYSVPLKEQLFEVEVSKGTIGTGKRACLWFCILNRAKHLRQKKTELEWINDAVKSIQEDI